MSTINSSENNRVNYCTYPLSTPDWVGNVGINVLFDDCLCSLYVGVLGDLM